MKTVTVPALKTFVYQDREIASGDGVAMRPVDALAAARRGDVSLDRRRSYRTAAVAPAPVPDTEPFHPAEGTDDGEAAVPPRRRRAYRRRDLIAESAEAAPE